MRDRRVDDLLGIVGKAGASQVLGRTSEASKFEGPAQAPKNFKGIFLSFKGIFLSFMGIFPSFSGNIPFIFGIRFWVLLILLQQTIYRYVRLRKTYVLAKFRPERPRHSKVSHGQETLLFAVGI